MSAALIMKGYPVVFVLGVVVSTMSSPVEKEPQGLEKFITACKGVEGISEIHQCIADIISGGLGEALKQSSPNINLPVTDPGRADDVHTLSENEDMKLEIKMTDVIFKGLSEIAIKNFSIDYPNKKVTGEAEFPRFRIQGKYKMNADLKELVLNGQGTFWMDFSGIEGSTEIDFEIRQIDGVPRVQILKPKMFTEIPETLKFRFNNLVNGDDVLDNAANVVLYENRYQLADLLYDDIIDAIAKFAQKTANTALRAINIEDMAGYKELKETFKL